MKIVGNFTDQLFEANYFTETCLKFKNEKKDAEHPVGALIP
jgi:hypothetical protein